MAERINQRLDPNKRYPSEAFENSAAALGALGAIGSPLLGYSLSSAAAPEGEQLIDRAELAGKYFDKDIDPRLKNLFLQEGGYGLQFKSGPILKELIPDTLTPFVPADLSMAGKYAEQLKEIKPKNYQADIITVTPGPNPARFATPELTPAEIGEGGAKGYIWGNPEEPQWSYALGNTRKEKVTTSNPTLYMTRLDLMPEAKGEFKTTGEVVHDPSLIANRAWGQRGTNEGDIYFPKETIQARGEVTAADLYTKLRNYGYAPPSLIDTKDPDKYFKKLAEQVSLAEAKNYKPKPINQVLLETASPTPPLGVSERERGAVPIFKEFDVRGATPEQRAKAGINQIFIDHFDPNDPSVLNKRMSHDYVQVGGKAHPMMLAVDIAKEPSSFAGRMFRNINPLTTGGFVAGALYSPEVFEDIEKGQYGTGLLKAGAAATTGAVAEGLVRKGVTRAAQAGIGAPARALAVANPIVASIATATLAPGSSPQPQAVGTYQGSTVFRNPQGAFVAAPGGKPTRLGQATQGGKPTFVPWGSVAGTRVGPRAVGRPWWDVGQFFGR
jgi:hypothetical protein